MDAPAAPITHASTAPADSGSSGLPQFDIAQWPGQVVWVLIVFAVMFILFSRVFVPRVSGTIADREDRIAGDIGDARRLKDQADAEAQASAAETAQARARAQRLAIDAKVRAQAEAAAADAEQQAKLAETLSRAELRIATAREDALTHLREIALSTASAMVVKLTGSAPTVVQLNAAQARGDRA
jgi:F-type H+-transporting ATPase subunit b